jgi:glutamate synthase domain-containing protein 1
VTAGLLKAQGLYDPAFEHDACGVAFVVRLDGEPTHEPSSGR